jgi:hypothetical protein
MKMAFLLAILLSMAFSVPRASAQGIESIMSPGKLAKVHTKWEDDCSQCHVKFDRQAQDKRCLDCHKETRSDVQAHTGFHGKMKPQPCRVCHAEHQGAEAKIVTLDKLHFDHKLTAFLLNGKHQQTGCEKCHVAGKKFRETPNDCQSCHRKDDVHKGSLGSTCNDCHSEANWKETKFDHEKTKFSLTGKHVEAKCSECHKDAIYKDTPKTCIACHRKADDQKGHRGQFGEKCESCHTSKSWKPSQFNHEVDTKYPLHGRHAQAKCTGCHKAKLYGVKLAQDCNSCHSKDDKHKETLGHDCQSCHSEKGWKEHTQFDHNRSDFPLNGKHAQVKCNACHEGVMFKQAGKECVSCHKKDDKHETTLGGKCADCHTEAGWKLPISRFDHSATRFLLRNAHAENKVVCKSCHANPKSFRNTSMDCFSCHRKDDKHEGQLGQKCEQCHSDRAWKGERFDHNKAQFALSGLHAVTPCKDCHASPRFRDAKRTCVSCHVKADKHKQAFGTACDSCHNPRGWPLWTFDHQKGTRYPLDGAHRKVACAACHTQPALPGAATAALSTNCYACHRSNDPHERRFGLRCEQCHTAVGWKRIAVR